ncbi:MAG: hypothetical protein SGI74_07860 [Oligoflexia bacterium]|nr:hypothetical protein [Oligoflexia bacterium]
MSHIQLAAMVLFVSFGLSAHADKDTCKLPKNVREIMMCDTADMEKLVRSSINMKEKSDNIFYDNAATVLAEKALSHPRLTERDAAIKELKNKFDQEYYVDVVKRAAEKLLVKVNSPNIAEQATAMVALTNLVIEVRVLKNDELKATLQKIADADLQISEGVNKYAKQPLLGADLISPSKQAKAALATL